MGRQEPVTPKGTVSMQKARAAVAEYRRRQPYSEKGISRVPCAKCGKPSRYQWTICADWSQYRGLCAEHDIEANELLMRWVWGDTREDDLRRYREKVLAPSGREM